MKILVISDIHGNLPALEAVLQMAGSFDAVWCLGDLVGYGPDPNACIEKVSSLERLVCLLGNHDSAALGQIDLSAFNSDARCSLRWTKNELSPESIAFLQSLPSREDIHNTTLAHGSPRNPVWEYILDQHTALENFPYFDLPVCLVGHTHLPMIYRENSDGELPSWEIPVGDVAIQLDEKAIINPGSVGQPRDHDPRASFAIYDNVTRIWEPRRATYDIRTVQQRIQKAGLPVRHAARLDDGW